MKVGTDGVLLGAWADINDCSIILDVGTGSGLITLMLAQRCNARIVAIDIEENAFLQSKENFIESPWSDRISIDCVSFERFSKSTTHKFDLIVCNPPYFNSLQTTGNPSRDIARFSTNLSIQVLITLGNKLLTDNGKICIILPFDQLEITKNYIASSALYLTRITYIKPNKQKNPVRILVQIENKFKKQLSEEFVIETDTRGIYSEEYKNLTKDFYLNF